MKNLYLSSVFLVVCGIAPSFAQDNHYDGLQLGSKNAILSGAAISRWVDQTAVVLNSATMMNAQEAGITFNSTAGSLDNIKFINGLGENVDIKTSDVQLYPGLVAADLPFLKDQRKNRLGIAIFARLADRTRYTGRVDKQLNIIDDADSPGSETFIGQYILDIELKETSGALAWSTRLNDHFSGGVTLMSVFRTHGYRENYSASAIADPALDPAVDVVSTETDVSVKINVAMIQLRGSLAWQDGPWSAGLVLTLPSLRAWSSGDMVAQLSLINIKPDSNSDRQSYFASAFLDKRKPVYKYPVSLSAGLSRHLKDVVLSAAVSWYGAQERYVVIDPGDTPYLQPPSEENLVYTQDFLEVWSSNRSVFNTFLSAEWNLTQRFGLLGGFRTDHHYAQFFEPTPPGFQLPKKIWNRYHLSLGTSIQGRFSRWIIGMQYTHGSAENYRQPYSLDGVSEGNLLQGETGQGTIRQNGLTGTLSFLFFVDRDRKDK